MNTTLPTAELCTESTPIETTSTPQNPVGQSDPYTFENGHWVGHDGFIVPANFAEFFERFPRYISNWVARYMPAAQYSITEREDRVSDLLLHLMDLPTDSIYRQPGANDRSEGCVDRIQVFHPARFYGASEPRFYSFLNRILLNHFISLSKKPGMNSLLRLNFVSIHTVDSDTKDSVIDESYLSHISSVFREAFDLQGHELEETVMVSEFLSFVEEHNPELIAVLNMIGECSSFVEAQMRLDMTEQIFMRSRNRLKVLYHCFSDGMTPPRQRKIYRPRAAKAARMAAANPAKYANTGFAMSQV